MTCFVQSYFVTVRSGFTKSPCVVQILCRIINILLHLITLAIESSLVISGFTFYFFQNHDFYQSKVILMRFKKENPKTKN